MNKDMVNFHSHKTYTNCVIADSPLSYEEYIERALELNQTVITSVEHGFQGNYWLLNELIEFKNIELQKRRDNGEQNVPRNLKMVFGVEAYWVKDRYVKGDGSNCHIIILAKNENGRKKINLALSKANEDENTMYGGRARLDIPLLLELPKDDVFVTTACIGYWSKYDDIEEITLSLHNHFKDNFMLEIQPHNTESQNNINKKILELSQKHNIEMIVGLDTHLISHKDIRRDKILEYKGLRYAEEDGWYLDYPDYNTIVDRFKKQGIFSEKDIVKSLENTLVIENFGGYNLNRNIKLPSLHTNYTQQQKDALFKTIINDEWKIFREKENIPTEEYQMYLEGIRYEVGEVIKTGMTDYFLIHYYGLKLGVDKYKGIITKRGRGSGVGYFINTLLGFSKVDRFKAPIKLYPERFLTSDRIILSKSLPDIDNNIAEQEPFVNAFKELLGEHSIYPMIAFGTLKKSSAIKLYMGAEGIEASVQNEVSKQLKQYDLDIKHCETDEEKELIDIKDYISKEYLKYVELSKPYQGIVISKSPHPCAFLLLNGDIREEIGLFRSVSESSKKSVLCACIEGTMADHYKYLKTDLLVVDVVGLTEAIWERIGEPSPSNTQLEYLLKTDEGKKAWDIYAKGYTMCVNQCEGDSTRIKCKRYKMKNTAELSAFVANIRPAFKSLINIFLDRQEYSTGVPQLDEVLSDSFHFMSYQESIMAYLNWLGIDMKETYDIVKKISKKVYEKDPKQMEELKNRCKPMWEKNVGNMDGFEETWQVMNDAGAYAFNSAHSYCVGNDGAEIAYTKAVYPYETYETCLNWFDRKKKKDKVALLKQEMKDAFGIKEGSMKFGLDNRQFTLDKENQCIHPSLSCIKGMGKNVADELYELSKQKKYNNFFELLIDMKNTSLNSGMRETLIKLDYFSDFGKSNKLLKFVSYFELLNEKKSPKKSTIADKISDSNVINIISNNSTPTNATYTKFNPYNALFEIIDVIPNKDISIADRIKEEIDSLNYIDYKNKNLDVRYVYVTEVDTKYTPTINVYCLNSGKTCKFKVPKKIWNDLGHINEGDFIYLNKTKQEFGWKKDGETVLKNGKTKPNFVEDKTKQEWKIYDYTKINIDEVLNDGCKD